MTNGKLLLNGIVKFLSGIVLVAILLFLPAGTVNYPRAWIFMALLFIPMFCTGLVMLAKAPALLAKRLQVNETQKEQKIVVLASAVIFIAGFITASLDFRFSLLVLPSWIPNVACFTMMAGYCIFAEVLRENAYLSRTVEVQKGQEVIDTGLYGVVRHPMYTGTLLLYLSFPLVLGSVIALPVFLLYIPTIVMRIRGEEAFLKDNLDGYRQYLEKVRYRLIPFVW